MDKTREFYQPYSCICYLYNTIPKSTGINASSKNSVPMNQIDYIRPIEESQ